MTIPPLPPPDPLALQRDLTPEDVARAQVAWERAVLPDDRNLLDALPEAPPEDDGQA